VNFEELKLQQQTLTTEQLKQKLAKSPSLWDEERRAIEEILAGRAVYEKPFRVRNSKGEWVCGMGRFEPLLTPNESEALVLFSARDAWEGYLDFEIVEVQRSTPQVDQNYPGFCCAGFDYEICLILPDSNPGRTEIYGVCRNPNCPNFTEGDPEDPWRGVNSCDLDDFEATLEEKGVKVAEVSNVI
jgi:hypothetical protein